MVTGAAGFMGRHLVRRLAREGWEVRGVDLRPLDGEEDGGGPVPPGEEGGRVSHHQADIREPEAILPLLEGADTLFHLASAHLEVNAPEGWYRSVNVGGAERLVEVAATTGIGRILHTSSVGVYGSVAEPPADEDAPKAPTSEYERTKLEGEEAARVRAEERGVALVILRPGWVYGPGCPRTARLLRAVRKGRFFFAGRGENLRHPIFIDDAVEAYLHGVEAPEEIVAGRPYLVVGPRWVTVRELVANAARALGAPVPRLRLPRTAVAALAGGVELGGRFLGFRPPISRRSLAFFEHDNAFSGERAERELGFRARVELDDGMERTVRALGLR